jgi:hypothetical protein
MHFIYAAVDSADRGATWVAVPPTAALGV